MQSFSTTKNRFQFNTFYALIATNNLIVVTLNILGRELSEVFDLRKNLIASWTNENRANDNTLIVSSRATKSDDFLKNWCSE